MKPWHDIDIMKPLGGLGTCLNLNGLPNIARLDVCWPTPTTNSTDLHSFDHSQLLQACVASHLLLLSSPLLDGLYICCILLHCPSRAQNHSFKVEPERLPSHLSQYLSTVALYDCLKYTACSHQAVAVTTPHPQVDRFPR